MIDKIKIGCYTYDVSEVDVVEKYTNTVGQIDYNAKTIEIDKEVNGTYKLEILFHEVLHAIDNFMGIGLEENEIEKLGKGLTMVLKDNPALVELVN
jgi:molecular chaperone GrpE (heat shock protein)